jgi:hypothetical protein
MFAAAVTAKRPAADDSLDWSGEGFTTRKCTHFDYLARHYRVDNARQKLLWHVLGHRK